MRPLFGLAIVGLAVFGMAHAETLTIATVNNGDMIRMQKLTDDFKAKHPGIELEWVTLEENVLRQKVTTDIATKGGQFDVMTIGTYEVPIWAKQGWLVPLDDLGADYDLEDLLPAIRSGLSVDGKLYAAPFYGERSMVMYRKDLMEKAGLTMPDAPTWDFIAHAARKMTDKDNEIYGICLRGKAGWGENMAFLTASSLYSREYFFLSISNLQFHQNTLTQCPKNRQQVSINSADPTRPTVKPVSYVGVQFVSIPEFQGLGTTVGQQFSAALAGQMSVDEALQNAQSIATREMTKAGYIK